MHISGAALIGGLADWYAVTALFGKPLGISYRTDIIVKQRDKLLDTAQNMFTEELLTRFNAYRVLKEQRVLRQLVGYFMSDRGQAEGNALYTTLYSGLYERLPWFAWQSRLTATGIRQLSEYRLTPLLCDLGKYLLLPENFALCWQYGHRILTWLAQSEAWVPHLASVIERTQARYSQTDPWREVLFIFGGESLSTRKLTARIQAHFIRYLASQESPDSDLARRFQRQARTWLKELAQNPQWQAQVEGRKERYLEKVADKLQHEALWLTEDTFITLVEQGRSYLWRTVTRMAEDEAHYIAVERYFLGILPQWLRHGRVALRNMLTDTLQSYSAEVLAKHLKKQLYYDLQMVRINGSLVGALLGGLFYLLAALGKAVWL